MHALPRVHRHLLTAESCTTEPVAELAAADGAAAEPASEAATEPDPAEADPEEEGGVPAAEATTDGETAGGEQVGASGAVEAQDHEGELQSAGAGQGAPPAEGEAVEGENGGQSETAQERETEGLEPADAAATTPGDAPAEGAAPTGDAPVENAEPAEVVPVKKKVEHDAVKMRFERGLPGRGFLDYYSIALTHSFGWETQKRNNLHRIDGTKLLTSAGAAVLMLDLETKQQTFLLGVDAGGIGAITVHPSGEFFAVGERQLGGAPNVYIYRYSSPEGGGEPEVKLVSVLNNGTERGFSDLRFSNDGELLATVGSMPDYLLHIWDWRQEAVTLRAKAFSQEVFNVVFSPRFDGTLYTSGTGHIRFWKMASTFTGLKLQGEIGRFGAIELSDVSAFVELNDGKIISGSENGNLLLWDGGLVKVEIMRADGPCHDGMVEMLWQHGDDFIVSAGLDGYLRFWDYAKLDVAEPEEDEPQCHIEPAKEYKICESDSDAGGHAKIKTMHLDPGNKYKEWLVQDDAGGLWRINTEGDFSSVKVADFHAGPIVGSDTSPVGPFLASAGSDGTVRLHNTQTRTTLYSHSFPQPCSCLHWAPPVVDPTCTTVIVGFQDGVVRVLQQLRDCWHLQHVIKPHTQNVTAVAFSRDGKYLASCSTDALLWLQSVALDTKGVASLTPLGFVKCKTPLVSLSWSMDSSRLMACSAPAHPGGEGEVLEFSMPTEEIDTSKTFEITDKVPVRPYVFEPKVIPPPPKPPKEDGDEEDEGEEPEPEVIPQGTPLVCLYVTDATFLLTYDGPESKGIVYECSFNYKKELKALETHRSPIDFLRVSHSGRFLMSGAVDGTGAIRAIAEPLPDAALFLSKCWRGNMHGLGTSLSGMSLDWNDQTLLTSATDGNLFLYAISEDFHKAVADQLAIDATKAAAAAAAREEELRLEELKLAEELSVSQAEPEDIVDPKHYSIQQEKIQAEEDRRMAEAEKKKEEMRAKIDALRVDFEKLLETNTHLPPAEQLGRDEFEVDPELRILLEKDAAEKVEDARKELAWESEKIQIGLQKLKTAFVDDIAVEHISLGAFRAPFSVESFRTKKLTPEQRQRIEAVHRLIDKEEANKKSKDGDGRGGQTGGEGGQGGAGGASGGLEGEADDELTAEELEEKGVPKGEIRKILRQQRQRKWKQLLASKPDDKYEDPKDVAAMEQAKKHMGDYKLKTSDTYKVPDHLRINAEKKRRQMVLLQESVYSLKMSFNDRFLALRDLKVRMKGNIDAWSARVEAINDELADAGTSAGPQLWRPQLPDTEFPEKRFEVSAAELDAKVGGQRADAAPESTSADAAATSPEKARGGGGAPPAAVGVAGKMAEGFTRSASAAARYEMSEVEKVEAHVRQVLLEHEKTKLLNMIEHNVEAFDEAVRTLRQERFKLDADLKMTDLRMLVLYQELKLLNEFEKRDNALVKKIDDKREEKNDVVVKIADCRDKIAARKVEIDKLNPKQVMAEFTQLVPETNKFHEQLLKIFKKKIKRQKKKAVTEGEEEDGSEEEDSDEDDMSDLDEDEEEEEEEDFCPPGCEPALFEQVCELREKRLDQEELLAEFTKAADALKKEQEALQKKEKIIDLALKQTDEEIQQFQTFKQQKLNEIPVIISLKMHQIKCVLEGKMPPDLSHTIVFTTSGLTRLRERIDELKDEKEQLRKNQKQLRREHVQLAKSRKVKEGKLKELEARARDVQMLKFGQEVDLDVLENISVNKTAEDLKEQLKKLETTNAAELKAWHKKIEEAAGELAAVTKQNTDKLERVSELTAAQHRLEKELNGSQSKVEIEIGPTKEKMKAEREQLVSLVKLQAREMEALKAEINMLRRKGGHVYTPVVRRGGGGSAQ